MSDEDIDDALERVTEPDEEPTETEEPQPDPEPESDGLLSGLVPELTGTGKSLDSYEDSPYRSFAGGAPGGDPEELKEKGEKHVARGIDGIVGGMIDPGHPFVDLAIGFFLIMLANRAEASDESTKKDDESDAYPDEGGYEPDW